MTAPTGSPNAPADFPSDIWLPPSGTVICSASDIEEGEARGFVLHSDSAARRLDMIVWHRPDGFRGFVNRCPHLFLPLETFPDRFLTANGAALVCSAHGAMFDGTGQCFAGPCMGDRLLRLDIELDDAKNIVLMGWLRA